MVIASDNPFIKYSGRIDFSDDKNPVFVFPCTYAKIRIYGTRLDVLVSNKNAYWDNYLGIIVDGVQSKALLNNDGKEQKIRLFNENKVSLHEVMIFKRQDACHEITLHGFEADDNAKLFEMNESFNLKLEFYGDSVSAGEVSEALDYAGKPDPTWHNGEFSNSYYSYAWLTARKLNASIHDIAQGGIALLNNTGWFNEPDYIGMEEAFDKVHYNPVFGKPTVWDFASYTPDVVVIAIGQNDSHPFDYMAKSYTSKESKHWRKHYKAFVEKIREIYPKAHIILCTTILEHDENWDKSIDEVCRSLDDIQVHHFLFTDNGKGTPGHIRANEAEIMASELSDYIRSLGIA